MGTYQGHLLGSPPLSCPTIYGSLQPFGCNPCSMYGIRDIHTPLCFSLPTISSKSAHTRPKKRDDSRIESRSSNNPRLFPIHHKNALDHLFCLLPKPQQHSTRARTTSIGDLATTTTTFAVLHAWFHDWDMPYYMYST